MIRLNHLPFLALVAAILFLGIESAQAATIVKPANNTSLVGFWPFEDGAGTTATDHSGYGNSGTLTCTGGGCTIPTWITGKRGKALDFSYISGSVYSVLAVPSAVPAASGNVVTVSVWYYNKGGGGDARIVNRGWCASMGWLMHIGYGFGVNNSTGCSAQYWASFGGLNTGQWYHLVGTFDGTTVRSYKDGVLMNSTATSGVNLANNNYSIEMMTSNNGRLDDVRIYNRVFSADEVLDLYRTGQTIRKLATSSGLVGYWPMNDAAGTRMSDLSSAGSHGTLTGGPTWVQGKRGQALSFDGVDDWVNGIAPAVPSPTNAFTASGWIYPDNQYARFLTPSANGVDNSVGYDATNQRLEVLFTEIADVNNRTVYSTSGSVPLNRWTHWAVSINDKNVKIYINGVLNAESNEAINIASWNGGVWYVGQRGTSAFWFKGKLDDLRVYNRVLSAAEVKAVYSASETVANAPQNDRITSGLVGYWTFNGKDVSGTTATDVTGSGNNGTITNGAELSIGKVGQGISFDGSNDYVQIPYASALAPTSAISFGGWFKTRDKTVSQKLMSKTETGGYAMVINEGIGGCSGTSIAVFVGVLAPSNTYYGACHDRSNITDNQWHHVMGTYDSETLKLYFDGELVNSNTSPSGSINYSAANTLCLGTEAGGTCGVTQFFPGSLDEMRVYNRAITATEVEQLYLMGK